MFLLPVCQYQSTPLCGSGLWPAADKRVVMRRRACWSCRTSIINMSHTPPLQQPLFFSVSVFEEKHAPSSTENIYNLILHRWRSRIFKQITNWCLVFFSLLVPFIFRWFRLDDLNYDVSFLSAGISSSIYFSPQLSDGCFISLAKMTVPFGGFFLQLVFKGGDVLWITEEVTHRLHEQRDWAAGWLNRRVWNKWGLHQVVFTLNSSYSSRLKKIIHFTSMSMTCTWLALDYLVTFRYLWVEGVFFVLFLIFVKFRLYWWWQCRL